MAAATTHTAKSAGFTPSGGSLWSMTDLLEISEDENGDVTQLTTDNSQVVNGVWVSSIKGDITLVVSDLSQLTNAGAVTGAAGALTVKYAKRQAGKGDVSGQYITVTYATVTLVGIRRRAGSTGNSQMEVMFSAYGTDGSTLKTASVGA